GAEPDAGHRLALAFGGRQGNRDAVAGDVMALGDERLDADLQALDGAVDVAHRAAERALFAEHVPRLEGLAQLDEHAVDLDGSIEREAELEVRPEPRRVEAEPRRAQLVHD